MVETHIPSIAEDQDPLIQTLLRYPPSTPHLNRFGLVIRDPGSDRGRGIYATAALAADTLIEISPVLLFPPTEYARYGSKTQLDGYTFVWKRTGGAAIMALALGLGSLFNHSPSPNVKWSLDYSTQSIRYSTVRRVEDGEELTISYGTGRMWWEPQESVEERRREEEERRRCEDPEEEALQMGRMVLDDTESESADGVDVKSKAESEEVQQPGPSRYPPIYRLTSAIDPQTLPLSTRDAWIIDIPPTSASLAVKFLQRHPHTLQNRDDGAHSTRHLRSFRTDPVSKTTRFLLCLRSAFPDRSQLVAWLTEQAGGIFGAHPAPYVGQVPVIAAPTKDRLAEWQAVWPCIVRTNPKESHAGGAAAGPLQLVDRKKDEAMWTERERLRWALNRFKRVVALARYAKAKGAVASAVHVTHPFDVARQLVPSNSAMSWAKREECDWSQLTGDRAPPVGRMHGDADPSGTLDTLLTVPNHPALPCSQAAYTAGSGAIEVDALDQRISRRNPLKHAAIDAVARVAAIRTLHRSTLPSTNGADYLLTSLSLFTLHEPCVYCTMALLHSRVAEIFFLLPSPGRGGCCGAQLPPATRCDNAGKDGGIYALQEQKGLNHSFTVWRWMHDELELPEDKGDSVEHLATEFDLGRLDP